MPILLDSLLSLPQSVKDGWTSTMDAANSQRAQWRDALAYMVANPGGGAEGDPGAHATHEGWMANATEGLNQYTRPAATRAILDVLGIGNETLSGALAWLGGHEFYSPQGYDVEDIEANRRGIQQGLLRAQAPASLGPYVPISGR